MAMEYVCPLRTRERILAMGMQGVGKSYAPLVIARRLPNATFHVIDTDYSESYARALDAEFTDLSNVIVHRADPDDFEEMTQLIKDVTPEVGYDDWLVFDSVTPTWSGAQSWFVEQVHGMGEDEYFMQVRLKKEESKKDSKSLGALEGWMDWPVINKVYAQRIYNRLLRCRGHLYMTAEQGNVSSDDDKEVRGMFGPYGVKPAGQKRLGFVPSTVLWFTKNRIGEYALTTIKDRNRTEMEDEPLTDFFKDYIVKVAGWKPQKVEE